MGKKKLSRNQEDWVEARRRFHLSHARGAPGGRVMRRVPSRRPAGKDPIEPQIEVALQPGSFIKYRAVWPFVEGLEQVEKKIAELVRKAPAQAVALYETFLAGCYEKAEELDDSSGNFGMFVDGLFCSWLRARQATGADPDETARRLVAWMDDDPYGFCYRIERDLVKVLDKRGLAAFELLIRERFDKVTTPVARAGELQREPGYLRRRAAEILRAILAERRNVDAYAALCEATELSPADCLALAKMLQVRRKPAEALAWNEQLRRDSDRRRPRIQVELPRPRQGALVTESRELSPWVARVEAPEAPRAQMQRARKLSPDEGAGVLRSLLGRHPEPSGRR